MPAAGGPGPAGGTVYYRTNLTMRQLAPLFGICPATVCRVVQRLRPSLALEPAPRPVADVDRLWIVDGILIPVRDHSVGALSRNYRFPANVQVIVDDETRLIIASARPAPGDKVDAYFWRESDLPAAAAGTTVTADGAYRGTPPRRPGRRHDAQPCHRRMKHQVKHHFDLPEKGLLQHPLPVHPEHLCRRGAD